METSGRILALDYGTRRIGLAISDGLRITTRPLGTVDRPSGGPLEEFWELLFQKLEALFEEFDVETLLLGLPKNMDGSRGPMAERVQSLREKLIEKYSLPVVLWDERLSSLQAEKEMIRGGLSRRKRKGKIDTMAAQLILQSYLDCQG